MKRANLVVSAAVAALVASGCSSSSDNGATSTAVGVRLGSVTARTATSITVNGAVIDDSAAKVTIDDSAKTKDDLQVGQIVTAKVDDKGKATEVRSHAEVRGKIDDKRTSIVTVGGQQVHVDDATEFDDNSTRLGGVSTGDRVRVHGFPDDKGGLRATRVEKDTSGSTDFEIHGVASAVGAAGLTLTTSPTATPYTVTLASAVTLPAGLVNGSFVEVKSATQPTATAIVASLVKIDDDDKLGEAQQEAEIEGIVTGGASASFVIAGRTVTTGSATRWTGGGPADLLPGVRVEAEGKLDAASAIAATKVSFKDSLRLQSAVAGVVPAASDGATNGTFKMFGGAVTVHVSDATDFDSGVANLTALAALSATQAVEVRGYPSASGGTDIVATRVKLGSGGGGGTRIFLQGPVSSLSATAKTLTVLGFTIDVSAAQLKGRDETTVVAGDFFASVSVGTVVKARADSAAALTGTTLKATEVELEDDK